MRRACVHIGLAVALVVTPTFCCCKAGWLTGATGARTVATRGPAGACGAKAHRSCCDAPANLTPPSPRSPAAPQPLPERACCAERPPAALTEAATAESDPRPSSAPLALTAAALFGAPEHAVATSVTRSSGGAGVDARYAKLFERHVLRC